MGPYHRRPGASTASRWKSPRIRTAETRRGGPRSQPLRAGLYAPNTSLGVLGSGYLSVIRARTGSWDFAYFEPAHCGAHNTRAIDRVSRLEEHGRGSAASMAPESSHCAEHLPQIAFPHDPLLGSGTHSVLQRRVRADPRQAASEGTRATGARLLARDLGLHRTNAQRSARDGPSDVVGRPAVTARA